MITVADFIMESAVAAGIRTVFTVPGGHAMYLSESAAAHPDLEVIYVHHEQTASVAASAYFYASNLRPAMILVTAGPGVMNCLSGVAAAYLDAVPMLVISGQLKTDDLGVSTQRPSFMPLLPTNEIVWPVTHWVEVVTDPASAQNIVGAAMRALDQKSGPVWLDIPLDIQISEIGTSNPFSEGVVSHRNRRPMDGDQRCPEQREGPTWV